MLYIVESKLRYEHLDIVFIEVFHKVTQYVKKKKGINTLSEKLYTWELQYLSR